MSLNLKLNSPPFLFIGSGFSIRYLGAPSWHELLSKYCIDENKPIEFYLSKNNSDYPSVGSEIARDYFGYWWEQYGKTSKKDKYKEILSSEDIPIKIDISEYLNNLTDDFSEEKLTHELSLEIKKFKQASITGIVTTNWDCLPEKLLPNFSSFTGEDSLLLGKSYFLNEIYKIHGSSKQPNTMILTKNDYDGFNKKYPYLSAKLLSIFIENPVVFIGYSMRDKNINKIFSQMATCMNQEKINSILSNNIYFLERHEKNIEKIEDSTMEIKDVNSSTDISFPIKKIYLNNFGILYESLEKIKTKIPLRIVRAMQEQIYSISKNADVDDLPAIKVIDEEQINDPRFNIKEIEFIVGIGIIKSMGYSVIKKELLFLDVLTEKSKYEPEKILSFTIPFLAERTLFLPIFKYLKMVGIDSMEKFENQPYGNKIHEIANAVKDIKPATIPHYKKEEYVKQEIINLKNLYDHEKNKEKFLEYGRTFLLESKYCDCDVISIGQSLLPAEKNSTNLNKFFCTYDLLSNGKWFNPCMSN